MIITVILVSPKGSGNVGSVARLLGNFGIHEFRLVDPRCDWLNSEARMMAMHNQENLRSAKIFSTLEQALIDQTFSLGFTGRKVDDGRPKWTLYECTQQLPALVRSNEKVALVFGREEWGLKLEELDQCNTLVEIPTASENTSLNLASAVAVALGFFYQFLLNSDSSPSSMPLERPTRASEEMFFKRLIFLLEKIGFPNPQNPRQNLDDLRSMFHRASLSDRDLRILFGILSGVERTLQKRSEHYGALPHQSL
jgi:tRNA/rRNA methyltransferase